jgi:hypothetical protein
MSVFDRDPASWEELQNMTGQLFEEMGCEVAIGKQVENVRGAKEIDVFVRDTAIIPSAVYLCECKLWKRRVPREVVHSFRTVIADIGAQRGFIISGLGFQAGAFEAAMNTNIDLITFSELQKMFVDRWRVSMGERFMPFADGLFPYWDPAGGKMPQFRWTEARRERFEQLMRAYEPLVYLGPDSRFSQFKCHLPIVLPVVNEFGRLGGEMTIGSYRQLYDFMGANKDLALYHFQVLHGEVQPNRIEGEYDPLTEA